MKTLVRIAQLCLLLAVPVAVARAEPAGAAKPRLLTIDRAHSFFVAVVRRSGLLSFVAHEHGVLATRWSAKVLENRADPTASSVELEVDAATLVVDTAEARRLAGLETGGPGDNDRAKIQEKMLGPEVLDAGHFNRVKFKSSAVRKGASAGLLLDGAFTLHGVTRAVTFPIEMSQDGDGASHYSGLLEFKLSDYGITPPSTGGVVNVKDEMAIRFQFVGR